MGLKDSGVKMSKSNKNDYSRINLMDSPELIRQKITRAKTDSIYEIYYDDKREELANLIRIFAEIKNTTPQALIEEFKWNNIGELKKDLAESLVEEFKPIREKTMEIISSGNLNAELKEGLDKARQMASVNMDEIKKRIGFI